MDSTCMVLDRDGWVSVGCAACVCVCVHVCVCTCVGA